MSKGSMLDLFLVFIVLLVAGFAVYAGAFILNIAKPIFNDPNFSNPTSTAIINSGTTFITWWDYLLPFLGISMGLVSIALAYFFPSHPLFFGFIGIMMIFVGILVMPILSNTFETFYMSDLGATVSADFIHLNYFMTSMPLVYTVMGTFMLIVIFTRSRQQGGG